MQESLIKDKFYCGGKLMRKFDFYWQSNRDWWEFKGFIAVLKPDAPQEAQESYQRYLKEIELYEQHLEALQQRQS